MEEQYSSGQCSTHGEAPHLPPYLVPQECGCHRDTRRALLCNGSAHLQLQQVQGVPFAFSALPYEPRQLDAAFHKEELPAPVRTVVTVYVAMRGVGGIDSWGAQPETGYQLPSGKPYRLKFLMT